MPDYYNDATLSLLRSASETALPPGDWTQITRAAHDAASAIPSHYRKLVAGVITEMDVAEKAAVDAAMLTATRDDVAARLDDVEDVVRAFARAVLDETNLHAARITAILDAIDGAASLGEVKTAVGAIPDVPTRTVAQMKTAVRGYLGT